MAENLVTVPYVTASEFLNAVFALVWRTAGVWEDRLKVNCSVGLLLREPSLRVRICRLLCEAVAKVLSQSGSSH